jgi:hypothetical protein
VSGRGNGAGSGSGNRGRKEHFGLYVCFRGRGRCIRSDVFDEVQTVLDRFELIKDFTECVVVNTGLVFKVGQSISKLIKSIICDSLLMYYLVSKGVSMSISLIRFEAIGR